MVSHWKLISSSPADLFNYCLPRSGRFLILAGKALHFIFSVLVMGVHYNVCIIAVADLYALPFGLQDTELKQKTV
jgi:hypothetical protein